jgi:hypothetical protein
VALKSVASPGMPLKAERESHMPTQNACDTAEKTLERALKSLAANMRAIGEGEGKPDELVEEIVRVAESLIAYNEACGIRPSQKLIRRALDSSSMDEWASFSFDLPTIADLQDDWFLCAHEENRNTNYLLAF